MGVCLYVCVYLEGRGFSNDTVDERKSWKRKKWRIAVCHVYEWMKKFASLLTLRLNTPWWSGLSRADWLGRDRPRNSSLRVKSSPMPRWISFLHFPKLPRRELLWDADRDRIATLLWSVRNMSQWSFSSPFQGWVSAIMAKLRWERDVLENTARDLLKDICSGLLFIDSIS